MIEKNDSPLVSVVVVTYNSSSTVIATLESVKNQTYDNIELIITDDGSKDDTIVICEDWKNRNGNFFKSVELVTTSRNTGTSANLNRGIRRCHGQWIKMIAGDDSLLPNCLEDNLRYINNNKDTRVLFSKMTYWGTKKALEETTLTINYGFFSLKRDDFYKRLLVRNFLPAPSLFIQRSVYDECGLYNESIPLMEDWPFWMKLMHAGISFAFLDKNTVLYRVHQSVSLSKKPNPKFRQSQLMARRISEKYAKEISNSLYNYIKSINKINEGNLIERVIYRFWVKTNHYHKYFRGINNYALSEMKKMKIDSLVLDVK